MFEDSLVESSRRLRHRGPYATTLPFAVQILLVGFLVLLPMIYTQSLPEQRLIAILNPQSGPVRPPERHLAEPARGSGVSQGTITVPRAIPGLIAMVHEEAITAPAVIGTVGSIPGGVPNGVMYGVIAGPRDATALPRLATPFKVRISSGVAEGMLLYQEKPQYPTLARQARVQGPVVLQAVIGKDGTAQNLHVLSGHPMLTSAAIGAVKAWRYRPYYLNGEAIEVDTQITVNFVLAGG